MARMTVKSLASVLGVSPATISNAYNRPDQLSAQLRERILATADELGYPGPDAAGRTLRIGRAGAVGVLLSERLSYAFSDPFAIEFLTGLSEIVEEHGISIVLMPLSSTTWSRRTGALSSNDTDGVTYRRPQRQHRRACHPVRANRSSSGHGGASAGHPAGHHRHQQ